MSTRIKQIIRKSQDICTLTGTKLTRKRRNILDVLASSPTPLSAYQITERYKNQFQESIPAMSVYRILDFLIKEKLIHKLETSSQYILCAHIACRHQHEAPQFLICDQCGSVREISIKKQTIKELERHAKNIGFTLTHNQLELHGICHQCHPQTLLP